MTTTTLEEDPRYRATEEEMKRFDFVYGVLLHHDVFDDSNQRHAIISFPREFSKKIRTSTSSKDYHLWHDKKLMEMYLNYP